MQKQLYYLDVCGTKDSHQLHYQFTKSCFFVPPVLCFHLLLPQDLSVCHLFILPRRHCFHVSSSSPTPFLDTTFINTAQNFDHEVVFNITFQFNFPPFSVFSLHLLDPQFSIYALCFPASVNFSVLIQGLPFLCQGQ